MKELFHTVTIDTTKVFNENKLTLNVDNTEFFKKCFLEEKDDILLKVASFFLND